MTIPNLIDKQDTSEIVRDKIASILVSEIASQMALATTAGKDPDDWKLRIFTERANPWEQWLNDQTDESPIVNIWFDNASFDMRSSNSIDRQKSSGIFNIDCYGYGRAKDDGGGGHKPGDREGALQAQKALRLVRNILFSAEYTYLGLRGLVWRCWQQSTNVFQPSGDGQILQKIVGARLAVECEYNEFAPEFDLETLDLIAVDVLRTEDGQIVLEADYLYPLP